MKTALQQLIRLLITSCSITLAGAYRIDLRVVVPPLAGFFASSGFDRVLAVYPTLRAAPTAPRGADLAGLDLAGRAPVLTAPVEMMLDHPHRDRLPARLGPEQQAADAQPPADRHDRAEQFHGHRAAEGQPVGRHVAAAGQVQDPADRE